MRVKIGKRTALAVMAAGALLISGTAARAVEIDVGSGSGSAGGHATFSVTLMTMTQNVAGTQNEISFDASTKIPPVTINSTLSGAIAAADTTITVSSAAGFPAFGTIQIDQEQISYGAKSGTTLSQVSRGQEGTTAAAHSAGAAVTFTSAIPDCSMASTLANKDAAFSFIPPGCDPATTCTGIRAFVLALNNTDAIADNAALYTCNVNIAADATNGDKTLTCANARASDPDGKAFDGTELPQNTTCTNGKVTVGPMANACVCDCDGDGEVSIGEVQKAVNILLGVADPSVCLAADGNIDGEVSIGEVQKGVNSLLTMCPQ